MEKEPQPESLATVTIKPDYPPSEVYSSEPPPAYHRSQSSTVQVTKIAAVTVVLVSIILGSFWLASAYVQANASCKQLEEELALLSEAADRFQPPPPPFQPPQAEALVQNESQQQKTEDIPKKSKDIDNNNSIETTSDNSDSSSESTSNESDDYEEKTPIKFKLPLQLDFDDLAGALIEKNQKSRMNCIVEKKRAEEVVDHQPKTLRLPFGLNLTTDPRYEHVSGERMAIFCESGNIQRNTPQRNDVDNNVVDDDGGDDSEEETIMIQPVMIPIPQSHFPTHMAHQMPQPQPIQYQQVHPMETMRPPMPPVMPQQQNQFPPNQILHHIAQQIVAQKIMEAQRAREQQYQQQQQQQEQNQEVQQEIVEPHIMPQRYPMMPQNIPLPEEVLTQLNRLPNRDVIVAVSEHDTDDDDNNQDEQNLQQQQQQVRMMPQVVPQQQQQQQQQEVRMMPHEIRVVQEPRQSAAEMNGRQLYARGLPVHIPVHMIQQQQQQQQQEPQAVASEETRPHYVQPRSLRSVDALLEKNQKRVKRCSCDCAC